MSCPSCHHTDVGQIAFDTVAAGARFQYCRSCEERWWVSGNGAAMELSQVLKAATVFAKS